MLTPEPLAEINDHYADHDWLAAHLEDVYVVVREAVYTPPKLHQGVEVLVKIHPFLLTVDDVRRWLEVLYHALSEMMKMRDNTLLMHLWGRIGKSLLQAGDPKKASAALKAALDRAHDFMGSRNEENVLYVVVNVYIELFRVQVYRQDDNFNNQMVQDAIALSGQIQNLELKALLYQVIQGAYTHREEILEALGYGQMAYVCWYRLNAKGQMAQVAFSLATACRSAGALARADYYLEQAKNLYLQTDDQRQYGVVAYEQGVMCRKLGNYEAAHQWYMIALDEFYQLVPPRHRPLYIAMTHHALANVEIDLAGSLKDPTDVGKRNKYYDSAHSNLEVAIKLWKQLDNNTELARAYHVMGYMLGRQGDGPTARRWFQLALRLCAELPDMKARINLEQLIHASIEELE